MPRLRSPNFPCAATSAPSIRPQRIPHPSRASREFSQSSCQQATLRRRRFYEWLNGPGSLLKEPLPGSTNYLGAYDRFGNLIRARPGWTRKQAEEAAKKEKEGGKSMENIEAKPEASAAEPAKVAPDGQETMDELEMSVRREEEKRNKDTDEKGEKDADKLPPETAEDLRPFPLNKHFRSQPVLSEELREAIYQRVARDGASVSLASVEFGVSNERVGAVVRLKQMEKEWMAQGKKLAVPYAKAVLAMLPTTPYIDPSLPQNKGKRPVTHEAINDLIVHPATRQQLFVPVSESRHFTRVDAGKAFDNNLLPADDRIPHPELVQAERDIALGLSLEQRRQLVESRMEQEMNRKKQIELKRQEELKKLKVVSGRRWDFVFQDVSVENVGRDGRSSKGVGWRYGFPHEDRKKGQVKIPTKVDA